MKPVVAGIVVAVAVVAMAPGAARAQHCHVDVPESPGAGADAGHAHHHDAAPRRWWLGVATTMTAGSGTVAGEARDYQGMSVGMHGGWHRFSARVSLPAYRVADQGLGLGDALIAGAADLVPGRGRVRAGLALSASAPTGDSDAGRGMGHAMVAAGAWGRVPAGPLRLDGAAMYARAMGDGAEHAAHAHGSMMWPLVDPMNPEEVVADARATGALSAGLRGGAGGTYAAPLSDGGVVRLVTYAVAELSRGRYTFSSQIAVPLVGDPFVARGTFELSYRH